jgi:hypothetical protein
MAVEVFQRKHIEVEEDVVTWEKEWKSLSS